MYWPGDFCPNGGYPVNVSGAPTSSIGGGNTVLRKQQRPSAHRGRRRARTSTTPASSTGNSVNTTNTSAAGITQGSSIATTNTPVPITRGSSTDTTNIGISGGVSGSGDTTSPGVVSANARSITINAPSGYAANSGDFQLVTVTARGLTSGWAICAVNTGWHTIATATSSAGTFVQTTFWTTTATAAGVFNIDTSSGCGTRISRTQATGDEVSAISVNYTGVNPATPLSATTTNQTGTTLTAPALANVPAGDEVVSVFGSAATFSTAPTYWVQGTGTTPVSTGADDAAQTALGAAPTPTAKTGTAAAWASETIALAPLLSSSISVAFPGDYSANTGDFLLVSVAVQGIAGDFVCTPTNWHAITASTSGSGGTALTQASFWTTSATTNPAVFKVQHECGVHRDGGPGCCECCGDDLQRGGRRGHADCDYGWRRVGHGSHRPPERDHHRERGCGEPVCDRGRVQRHSGSAAVGPDLTEQLVDEQRRRQRRAAERRESGTPGRRDDRQLGALVSPDHRPDARPELVDLGGVPG